ncbi:unnamed protein product [Sphagnum jensenii]|uniref:Homeobox domain-containing protein n=1 Tax=Sphagnum jensenii TaxID=128206 RepID=A0ABP1AQY3_9BRYO
MQENGMRSLVMGASSIGGMTTSSTWTSLGLSAVEEEEEEEEIPRLGAAAAAAAAGEKSDRGGGFELSSRAGTAAAGAGVSDDDEDGGTNTRKKLRLTKEQSALLEESFKDHSTLNPKQKTALAKQLHLRPRQVEVWFQNRRARTKLKQTEVDCEVLKRCCENLTQENHRLRKELQELRALKLVAAPPPPPYHVQLAAHARHDFYNNMPLPAATLTMCPSCKRLAKL